MSRRTRLRIRMDDQGQVEIVDPGWDCLELMRTLDPNFDMQCAPMDTNHRPRFLLSRQAGCGYRADELATMPDASLWAAHARVLQQLSADEVVKPENREASLLDLKIELARRNLMHCTLCAHRCGVDRLAGESGVCRLGAAANVAEHFVHIGEEAMINPSLLISLAGCGLRCRYCQQGSILDPADVDGESLDGALWAALDKDGARTLSFAGGNPDESLYAVLRFLALAPDDWDLPVVWNCHGAATLETVSLLHGMVDVWLPDYKYGNEQCGHRWSGIRNYPDTARNGIQAMLAQDVPVIVRILVLPGHFTCCHVEALKSLASLAPEGNLAVSIRGQYCPDWRIRSRDGNMMHRPEILEIAAVRAMAKELKLKLMDS